MLTARRNPMFVLLCSNVLTLSMAGTVSAQALSFTPVGSIPGPVDMVEVVGSRAYLADGKTLTIFDISDPAAPKRGGTYTSPMQIWGFTVVGSLAYVVADVFGLAIVDVSNAAAPTLRGSFTTPGQAKGVAVFGTTAIVADHMSGVDLVDVSNPTEPVSLGSYYLDGYSRDVAASGSLAVAVDSPTGFYVFDLSEPAPLEAVSSTQFRNLRYSAGPISPGSIQVSDPTQNPPIAVLTGARSLQVFDLSNPAAPERVATFRTPGRPVRFTLEGTLAYVADGPEGLQVVDLSTPSRPSVVGAYTTPDPARDVTVAESLVLVVTRPARAPRATGERTGEVLILRQVAGPG